MKELSIEEKAKRYDKVIERAKKVLLDCTPEEQKVVEYISPELKENEDEKSKKWILEYLHDGLRKSDEQFKDHFKAAIAWLEKQGEHAKFINGIQVGDKVTRNEDGVLVNLSQLNRVAKKDEKQGKQKPADKVEPKFKIGDWIVDRNGTVQQILSYKDCIYKHTNGYSSKMFEDEWRMWNVDKDAKDGDVLVASDGSIFIYDGNITKSNSVNFYVACTSDGTITFGGDAECGWEEKGSCHPATKEQREILFSKMKEAGYEWDAEKKELKKIEQKPVEWSEEDKNRLNHIIQFLEDKDRWKETERAFPIEEDVRWLKSLRSQKQQYDDEWSDEDKEFLKLTLSNLAELKDRYGEGYGKVGECIKWLNSLQPQPIDVEAAIAYQDGYQKALVEFSQKQQEWTDEDINMIDWLIRCCEKEHEELCNDRYGHQDIVSDLKRDCRKKWDWLESLKSRLSKDKE